MAPIPTQKKFEVGTDGTKTGTNSTTPLMRLLKIEIDWKKRSGRVTSLTGGHIADVEEGKERCTITISSSRQRNKKEVAIHSLREQKKAEQ